jgi:hypothetical protein
MKGLNWGIEQVFKAKTATEKATKIATDASAIPKYIDLSTNMEDGTMVALATKQSIDMKGTIDKLLASKDDTSALQRVVLDRIVKDYGKAVQMLCTYCHRETPLDDCIDDNLGRRAAAMNDKTLAGPHSMDMSKYWAARLAAAGGADGAEVFKQFLLGDKEADGQDACDVVHKGKGEGEGDGMTPMKRLKAAGVALGIDEHFHPNKVKLLWNARKKEGQKDLALISKYVLASTYAFTVTAQTEASLVTRMSVMSEMCSAPCMDSNKICLGYFRALAKAQTCKTGGYGLDESGEIVRADPMTNKALSPELLREINIKRVAEWESWRKTARLTKDKRDQQSLLDEARRSMLKDAEFCDGMKHIGSPTHKGTIAVIDQSNHTKFACARCEYGEATPTEVKEEERNKTRPYLKFQCLSYKKALEAQPYKINPAGVCGQSSNNAGQTCGQLAGSSLGSFLSLTAGNDPCIDRYCNQAGGSVKADDDKEDFCHSTVARKAKEDTTFNLIFPFRKIQQDSLYSQAKAANHGARSVPTNIYGKCGKATSTGVAKSIDIEVPKTLASVEKLDKMTSAKALKAEIEAFDYVCESYVRKTSSKIRPDTWLKWSESDLKNIAAYTGLMDPYWVTCNSTVDMGLFDKNMEKFDDGLDSDSLKCTPPATGLTLHSKGTCANPKTVDPGPSPSRSATTFALGMRVQVTVEPTLVERSLSVAAAAAKKLLGYDLSKRPEIEKAKEEGTIEGRYQDKWGVKLDSGKGVLRSAEKLELADDAAQNTMPELRKKNLEDMEAAGKKLETAFPKSMITKLKSDSKGYASAVKEVDENCTKRDASLDSILSSAVSCARNPVKKEIIKLRVFPGAAKKSVWEQAAPQSSAEQGELSWCRQNALDGWYKVAKEDELSTEVLDALSKGREKPLCRMCKTGDDYRWMANTNYFNTPNTAANAIRHEWKTVMNTKCHPVQDYVKYSGIEKNWHDLVDG